MTCNVQPCTSWIQFFRQLLHSVERDRTWKIHAIVEIKNSSRAHRVHRLPPRPLLQVAQRKLVAFHQQESIRLSGKNRFKTHLRPLLRDVVSYGMRTRGLDELGDERGLSNCNNRVIPD